MGKENLILLEIFFVISMKILPKNIRFFYYRNIFIYRLNVKIEEKLEFYRKIGINHQIIETIHLYSILFQFSQFLSWILGYISSVMFLDRKLLSQSGYHVKI